MADSNGIRAALQTSDNGVTLRIKVVPGSSRDRVGQMLGDRLKVNVSAPAQAGKANKAVCKLLAEHLDVPKRDVTVVEGLHRPTKTIHVEAVDLDFVAERLASPD